MSACSVTAPAWLFPSSVPKCPLPIAAVLIFAGLRQGFDEAFDKVVSMPF